MNYAIIASLVGVLLSVAGYVASYVVGRMDWVSYNLTSYIFAGAVLMVLTLVKLFGGGSSK